MSLLLWTIFRITVASVLGEDHRLAGLALGVWDGVQTHRAVLLNTALEPSTLFKLIFGICFDLGVRGSYVKTASLLLGALLGYVLDDYSPELLRQVRRENASLIPRMELLDSASDMVTMSSLAEWRATRVRKSLQPTRRRRRITTTQRSRPRDADAEMRTAQSNNPTNLNTSEGYPTPNVTSSGIYTASVEDPPALGEVQNSEIHTSHAGPSSNNRTLRYTQLEGDHINLEHIDALAEQGSFKPQQHSTPPRLNCDISAGHDFPSHGSPLTPLIVVVPPSEEDPEGFPLRTPHILSEPREDPPRTELRYEIPPPSSIPEGETPADDELEGK